MCAIFLCPVISFLFSIICVQLRCIQLLPHPDGDFPCKVPISIHSLFLKGVAKRSVYLNEISLAKNGVLHNGTYIDFRHGKCERNSSCILLRSLYLPFQRKEANFVDKNIQFKSIIVIALLEYFGQVRMYYQNQWMNFILLYIKVFVNYVFVLLILIRFYTSVAISYTSSSYS